MATIIGSTSTAGWTFKLEVVENSTSIANNSSKVTVSAYIGRTSSAGGSYLYGASITCPVSVTGAGTKNITYNNANQVNVAAGGWLNIGSVAFDNVPHDANGVKTVTVSANFTSNISPASGSASGSVKLTNIARASTFTIDKTTIYANGKDAIKVTINAKNTAYKHTIVVAMGSSYSQTFNVAAGVTTQAFTIPYEWLNGIPAQESSNSTNIILSTYNGTTLVGTASLPKGFTIWCPDDVKPIISNVTHTGNNLRDGVYVQGKSSATIKTVAGGVYGSTIASYSCVVDDVQYTGNEFTTAAFKWVGTYNLTVTVTDSRGRTASKTTSPIYVCEYKPPYISSFTAERQADGTTVIAKLVGEVSSLSNKNTKAFTVTLNGETLNVPADGYIVNGSVTFTGVDPDSTFVATAIVADYYTDAKMPVVVTTEAVTMDFHHSGKGVAFGKVAESENTLDVAWDIKCKGSTILDFVVEQGTNGLWTYRKWYSGIAECWGAYLSSNVNVAENNYSGFCYSKPIYIDLPFAFTSVSDFQANGGSNDRINFARQFGASNTNVAFVVCGHQADATSTYISVYLSVKGKWK